MRKLAIAAAVLLGLILVVPSLLQMRRESHRSEHPAIGDIRTVISAEEAYSSVNGGFYAPLSCLDKPATCRAGYAGPAFLDSLTASLAPRDGYARRFHPGPAVTDEEAARAEASPGSFRDFAYVAVPERVGETGIRAFCGDARGLICFTASGVMPAIKDGRCPQPGCQSLR